MPSLKIHGENKEMIHFSTFTVLEWIDIFTKQNYFQIIIDSLKFCVEKKGLRVFGYVVMPNHVHLLANAKNENQEKNRNHLGDVIRDFKKWTTFKVREELKNDNRNYISALLARSVQKKAGNQFQLWQADNYSEPVHSEKFFMQKLNYIHNNPVKKGFVERPEDWLYSSAKYYLLQQEGALKIEPLYE